MKEMRRNSCGKSVGRSRVTPFCNYTLLQTHQNNYGATGVFHLHFVIYIVANTNSHRPTVDTYCYKMQPPDLQRVKVQNLKNYWMKFGFPWAQFHQDNNSTPGTLPSMLKHTPEIHPCQKPCSLQTHVLSGAACHLPQMGGWHYHPSGAVLHSSLLLAVTTDFNLWRFL